MIKKIASILIISVIAFMMSLSSFAEESVNSVQSSNGESVYSDIDTSSIDVNELKYYIGTVVNTGLDNGYTGEESIGINDAHYGWSLGQFCISGYTRVTDTETPVFLKNVGDKVALWFTLKQDINSLNSDETLSIVADTNGYDEYFGIERTDFGKGALIIKHTDYQHADADPIIYTDYLAADIEPGADTKVELFEEGDYEVALDYEIKDCDNNILGVEMFPSYFNYRIFFKFSVRNGNCMVYPFDIKTKSELTNTAITKNGFYLDLAKSRYLEINIKKEVLKEGAEGLTEDTRFNRPAKDGDEYTEEGIYTITAVNKYTQQETTKKIYVGDNSILKAHVTTGLPINQIKEQLNQGAEIMDDGKIVQNNPKPQTSQPEENASSIIPDDSESTESTTTSDNNIIIIIIVVTAVIAVIIFIVIIRIKSADKQKNNIDDSDDEKVSEDEKR